MQLKVECRFSSNTAELVNTIRKYREGRGSSLDSWCFACLDAARAMHCQCYFRLETAPDGAEFQAVAVFL